MPEREQRTQILESIGNIQSIAQASARLDAERERARRQRERNVPELSVWDGDEQLLQAIQALDRAGAQAARSRAAAEDNDRRITALFHQEAIRLAMRQVTGATESQLAKAEAKIVNRELMEEIAASMGMAMAEGMDARIMGMVMEAFSCTKCKDGWVEVDHEKGEFELCECVTEDAGADSQGEDRTDSPLGYGIGRIMAGRKVSAWRLTAA